MQFLNISSFIILSTIFCNTSVMNRTRKKISKSVILTPRTLPPLNTPLIELKFNIYMYYNDLHGTEERYPFAHWIFTYDPLIPLQRYTYVDYL